VVRDGYWACFDTDELNTEPGPRLAALVDARQSAFADRYAAIYPAMKILATDREGLTAYLRFPIGYHHRIRHSNFVERTFGETRRRAKAIGRLPGETSCISIAWAVLDRASRGWRGLARNPAGLRQRQDLRHSLLHPPRQLRPQHTSEPSTHTTETVSATA
jgi:putative transposase